MKRVPLKISINYCEYNRLEGVLRTVSDQHQTISLRGMRYASEYRNSTDAKY